MKGLSSILRVSEEAKKALREIGLTEYELRVYLSLIERGVMTANELSQHSGVPYSKIYEVLNSLERKGWIEAEHGRPSKYYPKAPIEALEATKIQIEDRIKTWEKKVAEELQPIYEKRELREKPDIWILRGEHNIMAKIQEMIEKASSELMIAIPSFAKNLAGRYAQQILSKQQKADVRIMLMVTKDFEESIIKLLKGFVEVKVREDMFGGGVIADGREVLLILGEEKPNLVIWSDYVGLVKLARDYFQHLWSSSAPAKLGSKPYDCSNM